MIHVYISIAVIWYSTIFDELKINTKYRMLILDSMAMLANLLAKC